MKDRDKNKLSFFMMKKDLKYVWIDLIGVTIAFGLYFIFKEELSFETVILFSFLIGNGTSSLKETIHGGNDSYGEIIEKYIKDNKEGL